MEFLYMFCYFYREVINKNMTGWRRSEWPLGWIGVCISFQQVTVNNSSVGYFLGNYPNSHFAPKSSTEISLDHFRRNLLPFYCNSSEFDVSCEISDSKIKLKFRVGTINNWLFVRLMTEDYFSLAFIASECFKVEDKQFRGKLKDKIVDGNERAAKRAC